MIYSSVNSVVEVLTPGHQYKVRMDGPNKLEHEAHLRFQDGTINDVGGRNGLQNEEVLAILIDRMKFLNAKYPCRENSIAITKLDEALMWLEKRTADRKNRGVEGQHVA